MELSTHDSVAVLRFTPMAGYPRLGTAVLGELDELLHEVQRSALFSAVVIASNTQSFVTGAAIEEVAAREGYAALKFALRGQSTFHRIQGFHLPVVAAIRGYCLGGGLDLALACHARVASFDASFGHPGASLGLLTGWGGTSRLPRLVGKSTALEMFLTADRVPATQALAMGLVDELVPSADLVSVAARRAQGLLARGKPDKCYSWNL